MIRTASVVIAAAAFATSSAQIQPCYDCEEGVVMGGYDVVAFFSLPAGATGVKGSSQHTVQKEGYTFYFQTAANAASFQENPDKYIPAWGGFCAWGVAREGTDGNPSPDAETGWPWAATHLGPPCGPRDGWAIIAGRLFCTINADYMDRFKSLGQQGITDGDTRWTNWFGGTMSGPINTGCYPGPTLQECMSSGKPFPNRHHDSMLAPPMPHDELISKWADFKRTYGKSYTQEEEPFRLRVFEENLREAARLQNDNPLATFGVNAFSAMMQDEFHARSGHKGALVDGSWDIVSPIYSSDELRDIPASVDWRQKGAVTPVKDQGQCGSCWAFSTTGNIEGVWAAAGHPLTSLSEQELVSCIAVTPPGGQCHGGLASISFDWLIKNRNGDLITEAAYPYASHDFWTPPCQQVCHAIQPPGTDSWCSNSCYQLTPLCPAADCNCTSDHKHIGATISSWTKLPADEAQLRKQLASTGPIAIGVDSMSAWQGYTGGIVTNCEAGLVDHGVLLVGYGTDSGTDYWIIKNSWGASWGEKGYMRVKFGTNQCNLKSQATTAVVTPVATVVV